MSHKLFRMTQKPLTLDDFGGSYFGSSRSFKIINDGTSKSSSLVLVMISSMSVLICNCS